MMFFFDPTYFWYIFIPTMILSMGVQIYMKRSFSRWGGVPNSSHATGYQTTQVLFRDTSLDPVPVETVQGTLSDHYDPGENVVRLSRGVSNSDSVAAMAVAAHEPGHVQQYQTGSGLIKMRGFLLPALQFSPMLSYFALMMGLVFNMTGLIWVGIFFFSLMVLFSLLTLPVELNASRRALAMLDETGLRRTEDDIDGSKAVLRAAALTYLAAAVTSILQLLYYISIAQRRR
jgi:Zn-dependent membrane protease YugP